MLFTSLTFLFYFLPVCLILYYVSPGLKIKNFTLLIVSLLFYAWGNVDHLLVLLASMLVNFGLAQSLAQNKRKSLLYFGIIINVLILVYFKYTNFFIDNLNQWLHLNIEAKKIQLPLGISFFTFQQMSLLWDVYRDPKPHKITAVDTFLYVSFFPQLIAGPIVRYNDIVAQFYNREINSENIAYGIRRFILGLFRKVIIANSMGELADSIMSYAPAELATSTLWLGAIAYAFQIYFDFAGYSDMAIGLSRIFGFKILENFNFPYLAKSIQDFWRRWHISLSTWFRDYVYIPLGGNRKGTGRTYFNLILVFALTGFWHGATWSFMVWGLYHGTFLILERVGGDKILKGLPVLFQRLYALTVVLIGWVLFRIENIGEASLYIANMFTLHNGQVVWYFLNNFNVIILGVAVVASTPIFKYLGEMSWLKKSYARDLMAIIAFVYSVIFIVSNSYNPFIYFRF